MAGAGPGNIWGMGRCCHESMVCALSSFSNGLKVLCVAAAAQLSAAGTVAAQVCLKRRVLVGHSLVGAVQGAGWQVLGLGMCRHQARFGKRRHVSVLLCVTIGGVCVFAAVPHAAAGSWCR